MSFRRNLRRAALATIVVAGAVLGVGQGATQAADSCRVGESCVEVHTHRAGSESTNSFTFENFPNDVTDYGPILGTDNVSGAKLVSLVRDVPASSISSISVTRPGQPNDFITLTQNDLDDTQNFSRLVPVIFTTSDALGFARPKRSATDNNLRDSIPPRRGEVIRIDVYVGGRPLKVTLTGPDKPKLGQPATYMAQLETPTTETPAFTFDFGDGTAATRIESPTVGPGRVKTTHTFEDASQGTSEIKVDVATDDGSSGRSNVITADIGERETKPGQGDNPGSGSGGKGSGKNDDPNAPRTGPDNSSGTQRGATPSTTPQSGGAPIDPFRVPPSADGPFRTELPSGEALTTGEQVAGLVLTGADGEGPLSDRDPSQQVDEATAPAAGLGGKASPIGIILLVAGVLLVLMASAASELAGLQPTRRKTTPPKQGAP